VEAATGSPGQMLASLLPRGVDGRRPQSAGECGVIFSRDAGRRFG